jgi:DNA-binding CsgD family transcriptional regulator
MPSTLTRAPETWREELALRRHRLADTVRSLVRVAQDGEDSNDAMTHLVTATRRWDSEPFEPDQIADLLAEVDAARVQVARRLPSRPLLAARRVSAGLERVQAGQTLSDIARLAPAELCWAGDFDRVLLSRIEGSSWIPESWHAAAQATEESTVAFGHFIRDARIPLGSGMIEAEVVRRRRTVLVGDAAAEPRTFPALVDVADCRSYVVAPVMAGDRVVGLLHADTRTTGRLLTECDCVTVRSFADGLGLVLERLALLDQLAAQRAQISAALAAAERAVEALTTAPVTLDPAPAPAVPEVTASSGNALEQLLTVREREVFAVLVSGATNAEIADRLTVSETTVKSHVKHILRKLRAHNRAEAIARYLAITGNPTGRPEIVQPSIPPRHGA